MASLKSKVDRWKALGIIDAVQAGAILRAEEGQPSGQRQWTTYGIVGLGVVVILTGIVSLVAANWDDISYRVKLGCYFLLQLGLGAAFVRWEKKEGIVREATLTAFALLFLSGIGLVGQIYNLSSDGWQAILFWLALILPITWLAQSRLINHLWFLGLSISLGIWFATSESGSWKHEHRAMLIFSAGYGVAAIGALGARGLIPAFTRAASLWGYLFLLGLVTPFANFAWYARVEELQREREKLGAALAWPWIAALGAAAAAILGGRLEKRVARLVAALYVGIVAYATLPFFAPAVAGKVQGCVLFILIWALAATAAARAERRRLFDAATFIIAVRFIFVYFEVFGSLMATGVGLIVSGITILGVAYSWNRLRKAFAAKLEGNR